MADIVLIHGAWMNGASWAHWVSRYEALGHNVIAPSWPYDDRPVAELKASPSPELVGIGVAEIVGHYERLVRELTARLAAEGKDPPLLIGHSFGGLNIPAAGRRCGQEPNVSQRLSLDETAPRWRVPVRVASL